MKRILAFAGSNHSKSINFQLVSHAASLVEGMEVNILDIHDWDVPMYSLDLEGGPTPEKVQELINLIQEYDGFIIASPEHNGGTPAFLKNILDWMSRKAKKVFADKPLLLISTSPGAMGGANHLKFLAHALTYQGANTVSTFSLPTFHKNFQIQPSTAEKLQALKGHVNQLVEAIQNV